MDCGRVLIITCIAIICIAAAGCAPLYVPNPIYTPMIDSSGEVHLSGYVGSSIFSGNVAVSATDNLMLVGAYSFEPLNEPERIMDASQPGHVGHRFWEGGMGWYGRADNAAVEMIAGYGAGEARAYWPLDDEASLSFTPYLNGVERVDGSYRRIFLQGSVGNSTKRRGSFGHGNISSAAGLAIRTSYVWFSRLEREGRPTTHPAALFIDPVLFMRLGSSTIQGEMQLGGTVKIATNDDLLRSSWFFFNIGLHLTLDRLW